ncbi:helix-turn-helix transcriptional regulator [Actinokineospora pegani]|uniref:helix-turn-helix transcriptional regulator n=1 Tax=Actinokineospora pegani TaxID=2654637 RepID=UPI0012E9B97D|nr:helix-turn-helix transcriptional regulator [Actinokineospora pegani]
MDRAQLADFLQTRRDALQPEDVGLPRGPRRRTAGLRREEVAALCGMSADYYTRLEQRRGPQPSEQMLAAIARGLRLSLDERDHLFRLAGHNAPGRGALGDHIGPGMTRILDRLADTPAMVVTTTAETLRQTDLAVALVGDETRHTGLMRSMVYRWFTDAGTRSLFPEEDHREHSRVFTSDLRAAYSRLGGRSRAGELVDALLDTSAEFRERWEAHEVGVHRVGPKRLLHPDLGLLVVHCQTLHDADHSQVLLVYTATPGSESHEKLRLLPVLGERRTTP